MSSAAANGVDEAGAEHQQHQQQDDGQGTRRRPRRPPPAHGRAGKAGQTHNDADGVTTTATASAAPPAPAAPAAETAPVPAAPVRKSAIPRRRAPPSAAPAPASSAPAVDVPSAAPAAPARRRQARPATQPAPSAQPPLPATSAADALADSLQSLRLAPHPPAAQLQQQQQQHATPALAPSTGGNRPVASAAAAGRPSRTRAGGLGIAPAAKENRAPSAAASASASASTSSRGGQKRTTAATSSSSSSLAAAAGSAFDADGWEEARVLEELGDASKLHDDLAGRLRSRIKACAKAPGDRQQPFAMRALAQLAVTMEALIKEKAGRAAKSAGAGGGGGGSGSDGRSSRNHARLLADLTAICLDPSTSFLRGFSAEKIASNIVTRLVDFGEPNFALRLLEAVMQSLQAPSTLGRRAELSRSARFTGKDSLSWRAFLDLLTFEYQGADSACSSPPPPNALIAACLLNAFKCVVTLFPDLTWQEFTTIAKSPFGLVPWFHRLKTENLDLGRRFFDIIFRFLYKLCSESVSAFPARCIALECFAETSLFDQTRFLELLGRYVVDDCKEFNPISLSNIVCWSFEQFVLRETHPSLLLPFVDRVFVLAKKHPQFQIPPAALNFADHLASKSDVTALDGFKRAALALYVMLECSMDSTRFTAPVANMNPIVTRILAIVSDCSWTGMLDAPALKLLYRIQEISKLVAQGLPASPNSDEKRAETAVMAADLSTSILLTLNQDFPEDRMKATVNAVIWMAADTAGILARQETAVSHSSSADQRALHLDRLTRAFRLCKKFDLPDVMKSTAVTSLSVGCSLLRRRLWDDALSFFVLSAECWESFELSVGRDWIKDEGNIKIFIRLAEAQSACHTGAGNAKGAAEVCAKAIWKLCDVCSHDLVNRLLEQFFRIAKDRPSLTFLELSKNMGVFDYAVEGVDMSLAARALKICGEEIKYRTQRLENRDVTVHIIDNCVTVARQNAIWAKTVLFLFEKAKVLRELGEASCGDVAKCCKDAIEIATEHSDQVNDEPAFADVLANCYFLLGLALNESKSFSMDPFQSALNKWQSLLLEVPPFLSEINTEGDFSNAKKSFASLELTITNITFLSVYFEILDQPLSSICCCNLLLRLIRLRDTDTASRIEDAIRILSSMAINFITAGFVGKAGIVFARLKQVLSKESDNVPLSSRIHFNLCYAMYLAEIGNETKSLAVFPMDVNAAAVAPPFGKTLLAFAYFVRSKIFDKAGNFAGAIHAAELCAKVLGWCAPQQHLGRKGYSQRDASDWRAIQQSLVSYLWLSCLLAKRGSTSEADYYLKCGQQLAESCHSKPFQHLFSVTLAEIGSRKEVAGPVPDMPEIGDFVFENLAVPDMAILKMQKGDLLLRAKSLPGALELYTEVDTLLDKAMRDSISPDSESLLPWNAVVEKKSTRAKTTRKASPPTPSPEAMIDLECLTLLPLKAKIAARIGSVFKLQGKEADAVKKFADAESAIPVATEEREFMHASCGLKFDRLRSNLSGDPLLEMFPDCVVTMPWCVPSKAPQKTKKKSAAPESLSKSIDNLGEISRLALMISGEGGPSRPSHELAVRSVSLSLMKAFLTGGLRETCSVELARMAAFDLDRPNGLTSKKEFVSVLFDRHQPALTRENMAWPSYRSKDDTNDPMTAFPLAHACVRKNVPDGPKIQESFLESLPENWAVVSISADLSSDVLLLSRLTRSGSPVVVRLPMARVTDREGESDGLTYSKVMDEFQSILSANDRTAGVAASSAAASYSKADWWAERTRLDEQLEVLLEQIESSWLGGFRGFFTVDPHTSQNEVFEEFREKIGKLIARTVSAKVKVKAPTLDVDLCRMILQLGPDPNPTDIEDLLYYMMDAYQFAGCPVGYDELNIDSMEGSLSDAVRDYHLRAPEGSDQAPEHIVLILDKYVNGIPWESLPCLRHRSVSRLPALAFLETRLLQLQQQQAATADPSSLFYVLNPEKDLVNTESQFKGFLSRDGWEGIVGAAPTEVQIEKELASKDIYMYFGHGGGEQYVRSHKIRKLEKCAVSLLMGCSSGRLKPAGEYDPSGIALSYMIAGCPALVANLWDVTDRDIDRFSAELFRVWGLGGGAGVGDQRARGRGGSNRGNGGSSSGGGNGGLGSTLCEAVAASRDRCRMKYLVGAAPVVYGVPVRLAARAAAVAS